MKDNYELLNDVTIDENELEELEVTDIEKAKIKRTLKNSIKNRRNHYKKKAIAASTIAVVSTGVFVITFPAYAKNVPIGGDIFRALDN